MKFGLHFLVYFVSEAVRFNWIVENPDVLTISKPELRVIRKLHCDCSFFLYGLRSFWFKKHGFGHGHQRSAFWFFHRASFYLLSSDIILLGNFDSQRWTRPGSVLNEFFWLGAESWESSRLFSFIFQISEPLLQIFLMALLLVVSSNILFLSFLSPIEPFLVDFSHSVITLIIY